MLTTMQHAFSATVSFQIMLEAKFRFGATRVGVVNVQKWKNWYTSVTFAIKKKMLFFYINIEVLVEQVFEQNLVAFLKKIFLRDKLLSSPCSLPLEKHSFLFFWKLFFLNTFFFSLFQVSVLNTRITFRRVFRSKRHPIYPFWVSR